MFDVVVRSMVVLVCLGLGGMASALAEPGPDASPKSHTYVVKAGDTLDKVVRASYPNSPLRPDLLRDEVIRLNPAAFTKGAQKMLMAGATLQLPSHDAVVNKHLGKGVDETKDASPATEARRHWVRYP